MKRLFLWLEQRWVAPASISLVLTGIALAFFAAATNTMAGWLYVISGTIFAMLLIGAILPVRSLRRLWVRHLPIAPVSAGDKLAIELEINNPTSKPITLLQAVDLLPPQLGKPVEKNIDFIPARQVYRFVYYQATIRRGVYRWDQVQLRTAAPLGLFWHRRSWQTSARAIVYPQILPLSNCSIVDNRGQERSYSLSSDNNPLAATEGITRSLRPYRRGDPTRLIHWRSSARYGELRVRELETLLGGQEIIICLDTVSSWDEEAFEVAVTAAASLYMYALRSQLDVKLWTAQTGLVRGKQTILELLARINFSSQDKSWQLPGQPLIWLTSNQSSYDFLPNRSRWLLFDANSSVVNHTTTSRNLSGLVINLEQSLQSQLES